MDLIKVNNAIISDKIYIKEEDIPNILEFQAAFTYMIKKELLYMYTYENGVYSVPSNSYYKLDIDNYDDQRISVPMSTTYTSNATLRLDQQDVVDAFFQIKNRVRSGLIQAPCGWGKCQTRDSQILTNKGLLQLSEINTFLNNNEIIKVKTFKGEFAIKSIIDNGIKPIIKIKTQLGNILKVTENHPLLTWNTKLLQYEFKIAKELSINDYLIGEYGTDYFGTKCIEEDPYVIGLLIGDGSLTIENKISITSHDDYILQYVNNILKDNTYLNEKNTLHKSDKDLYKKYVTQYKLNTKSIYKKLDLNLRSLNKNQTILLLKGLFDTDGCVNKDGTIEYCSSSEKLAYWVFETLLNLGIVCRIKQKKTTHEDTYIIDINSKLHCNKFLNIVGFNLLRKQQLGIKINNDKNNGSITTGLFPGLNNIVFEIYNNNLIGKGYSDYFSNYKKNNISLNKFKEILEIFKKTNTTYPALLDDIESLYCTKIVAIEKQLEEKTFGIEIDGEPQYISGGIINHNTFATIPLILRANQKTLIIVHTKLLFNQWIKEFKKQVPSIKLGEIGAGKYTLGDVTIGLYKSVANRIDKIKDLFGLCIVDEAHRSPANLFSQTVNNINCKYKIAITATPRRKDGKHIVLKDYFTAFKIIAEDALTKETPHYSIIRAPYEFKIKHPKLDWAKELNRLAENRPYLDLIAAWANYDIKQNRAILIVSDRLQMLKVLKTIIPKSILLVGDTDDDDRDEILGQVGTEISAILSTSIFDEGVSCHRLDTMYFTCPSNNDVKWEQRIGRIQREHIDKQYPLIRDFWLKGIIVARQQANRLSWYEQRRFILDEENPI